MKPRNDGQESPQSVIRDGLTADSRDFMKDEPLVISTDEVISLEYRMTDTEGNPITLGFSPQPGCRSSKHSPPRRSSRLLLAEEHLAQERWTLVLVAHDGHTNARSHPQEQSNSRGD